MPQINIEPIKERAGLLLGFGALLALMVILASISLSHMKEQQHRLDDVVNKHMLEGALASRLRKVARERTLILYRIIFIEDPFVRDEELLRLGELAGRFGINKSKLLSMQLTEDEINLLNYQGKLTEIAVPIQDRIVELSEDKERNKDELRLVMEEAVKAQDDVLAVLDQFEEMQREVSEAAAEEAAELQQQAQFQILLLSAVALAIGLWVSIIIVRSVRRAGAKNAFLATHDVLTQLPNRTLLLDRLQHEIARGKRHKAMIGVLFIDLDYFKQVNDTYGHATGDALLLQVTDRMNQLLRQTDTLARLGGDEFVLVLADAQAPEAIEKMAAKLVEKICQPFDVLGKQLNIGASIGISIYPHHGENAEALLHNADLAMYAAKEAGRKGWHMYERV